VSGQTVYAYTGDDPTDKTDPSGECEPVSCADLAAGNLRSGEPSSLAEGAEIAGSFVPGVSEVLAGRDFINEPSLLNAGIFGLSLVDLGGVAKAVKTEVKAAAAETRAANLAKGIPASKLGPSGKPKVHTVEHSTRKEAREAAKKEADRAGGEVRHDANPQDGQKPHFQAEDAKGENVKPVVHHCPPGNNC
jgi:hypothetical protein